MNVEQYAFDVVDELRAVTAQDAVMGILSRVMDDFGFRSLIVTGVPLPEQRMEPLVLAARWPQGWTDRYMAHRYHATDPAMRRVRETLNPFRWNDVRSPRLHADQIRVLDEAGEFGLPDGFAVPIHALNGFEAVVSFGTDRFDLDARRQAAINLISLYAYEALRNRPDPGGSSGGARKRLSPRERECVQWTAAGKTAWEIGQILGISEASAKEYLDAAARKLESRTRPQLVARCLREGLIS